MERIQECHRQQWLGAMACALLASAAASRTADLSASVLTGWTTVGSAGTVDEGSVAIVRLRGPFAELGTQFLCIRIFDFPIGCSLDTGTATLRYNIVAAGSLFITPAGGPKAFRLSARLRDTGDGQRVFLLLKEVNLQTGDEATLQTIDSDSSSSSPDYQTVTGPNPCQFTFDFDAKAYYVETLITNSLKSGRSPGIEAVWIDGCGKQ